MCFEGPPGPLIVEMGTSGEFALCAGSWHILPRYALFGLPAVKFLVSVWSAFGWVLERSAAYDLSERLTTNSRSFIIDAGC